ncbi:MAG: choice-of-anchor I family protein [Gemmiger sp.]
MKRLTSLLLAALLLLTLGFGVLAEGEAAAVQNEPAAVSASAEADGTAGAENENSDPAKTDVQQVASASDEEAALAEASASPASPQTGDPTDEESKIDNTDNVADTDVPQNDDNTATAEGNNDAKGDTEEVDAALAGKAPREVQPVNPIIDQVYGGGGKGETPISNSFIELYNPSDKDISLSGCILTYGDKTLALSGTIPANGSYLVIGAAETTTDDFLTYDLPAADQTCDWVINNKSYTIQLVKDGTAVDSVTAGDSDATKISKQKSLKRNNHGDFALVVWEKTEVSVNEAYVAANAPRNSKGDFGKVYGADAPTESPEPTDPPEYTPVVAGEVRVTGFNNEHTALQMELAARYNSEAMNEDGGSLEIVAYNPENGFAYAVSGVKGKLIAVDLNDSTDGDKVTALTGTEYDVKSLVEGFTYGDMTSVAVSPDGSKLAVAIQAENYADKGVAALFACGSDGSLTLLSTVTVGVQPDMITFANENTLLTADEGEPRNGAGAEDPKGSVSIVTIGVDNALSANTVDFTGFDAKRDDLTAKGVLIQKDTQPSTDFEPEYIAVSGGTAYVSLQEANAIAVLDIGAGAFTGVYPLGFQDYGTTEVDLQKNDTIELQTYPNVYGIKMPDGITVTTIGGKTYLLTANEGDSRADWAGLDNEYENVTSPTGNVTLEKKVVWFNANLWDGLDSGKAYVFGGRSFSMYEVTENGLNLVFDSGSGFEEITAETLPANFNTSNDKTSIDNRSGKKGPEPESVVTGTINGKTYAFVALERIGGIMVYDITNPANVTFVNYINSREFDEVIKGDVSPEGLCFIPASESKTGKSLLLAACEVSGTLAAYECDLEYSVIRGENAGGENGDWTQGNDGTLTIKVNGDFDDFQGIEVGTDWFPVEKTNEDGTVEGKIFTARKGSTIVTLKANYIQTLTPGNTYHLAIVFGGGAVSTNLIVQAPAAQPTPSTSQTVTSAAQTTVQTAAAEESKPATPVSVAAAAVPQTGDESHLSLWILLLVISLAGLAGTAVILKKQNHTNK